MAYKKLLFAFILTVFTLSCENKNVSDKEYKNSGYTKEELITMGIDTLHVFVFTDRCAIYNGKLFSVHQPLDSFLQVFGSYNRIEYGTGVDEGYNQYFWDEIGFCAVATPEKFIMRFDLHWDHLPAEKELYERDDSSEIPAKFFKSKILLNGIPLDNTSDIKSFCENPQVRKLLREWARKAGYRLMECLYDYPFRQCFHRYNYLFHKLYVYDYKKMYANKIFEQGDSGRPFFSYVIKIDTETGCMHSFGMGYDVYTNPYSIKLF